MSNFDSLGKYVNKIIKIIINSEDCIKLINPTENELFDVEDILLGGEFRITKYDPSKKENVTTSHVLQPYIYDFNYTLGTTDKEKVFICIDATVESMSNIFLTDFLLHIFICVPKSMNRLSKFTTPTQLEMEQKGYFGNRANMLCSALDKKLNGNSTFGGIGDVRPSKRGHVSTYYPTADYYGKHLVYTVSGYNEGGDACDN